MHSAGTGASVCTPAAMGINGDWARIWREEGNEYVRDSVNVDTVFMDGQIMLMQSQVSGAGMTWDEFVRRNFSARLDVRARAHSRVIIAFDNYEEVPVYKSLEQTKRTAKKRVYTFVGGDSLGRGPPDPEVWQCALQNRTYKTHVISMVCNTLARSYRPQGGCRELLIDFVDTVRLCVKEGVVVRDRLSELAPMGESDVKFMRYANLYGDILVESIDSDVLLIAFMYVQRCTQGQRVFVRRFATAAADDAPGPASGEKRGRAPAKRRTYEIVDVRMLLQMLHVAVRQAIGDEVCVPVHHVTHMVVLVALLGGSDFSRKLPLVGARYIWEQLPNLLPVLVMASNASSHDAEFAVDAELWLDLFMRDLYRLKFERHVRVATEDSTLEDVLEQIAASKLAPRTKEQLPSRAQAACTLQNMLWILQYWGVENGAAPVDHTGAHGFLVQNGRVSFCDTCAAS